MACWVVSSFVCGAVAAPAVRALDTLVYQAGILGIGSYCMAGTPVFMPQHVQGTYITAVVATAVIGHRRSAAAARGQLVVMAGHVCTVMAAR